MPAGDVSKYQAEWQGLGYLVQKIKSAATECSLPVVATTQQSKAAIGLRHEDQIAGVEGTMGASDRISQFASANAGLFTIAPEMAKAMAAKFPDGRVVTHNLVIGGNRNGASGVTIPLSRGDDLRFVEATSPEILDFVANYTTPVRKQNRFKVGLPPVAAVANLAEVAA
jgi:hypothetical protein